MKKDTYLIPTEHMLYDLATVLDEVLRPHDVTTAEKIIDDVIYRTSLYKDPADNVSKMVAAIDYLTQQFEYRDGYILLKQRLACLWCLAHLTLSKVNYNPETQFAKLYGWHDGDIAIQIKSDFDYG